MTELPVQEQLAGDARERVIKKRTAFAAMLTGADYFGSTRVKLCLFSSSG